MDMTREEGQASASGLVWLIVGILLIVALLVWLGVISIH